MKKTIRNTLSILFSVLLMVSLAGCGPKQTVTKADTKEDTAKMAHEFYDALMEEEHVRMTGYSGEDVLSIVTIDGEKLSLQNTPDDPVSYLFRENGKTYFLSEDGDLSEDTFSYDFYRDTIRTTLTMFVMGLLDSEETGSLNYSAVKTDKTEDGKALSELVINISGEENGEKAELTLTGNAVDSKVGDFTFDAKSGETAYSLRYLFDYDNCTVTLPEYTIVDYSKYYHHVDSEFATVEELVDAMGEAAVDISVYDSKVLLVTEKDGRHLQYVAELSPEDYEAFWALDNDADDYFEQEKAIYCRQTISDCVDFTEAVMTQEEQNAYTGKTVKELRDEDFEIIGWGVADEAYVYLEKGLMEYEVSITIPEGYDENTELDDDSFNDCTVLEMRFSVPGMEALPME
ncbi:MAG: hypothetical protein IIZ47_04345 [Erysipelotrichaceae bacterium]|nr:hypothetical protein [Erysipelotrichaceae bacterium]